MQAKAGSPLLLLGGMDPSGAGLSTDIKVAQSFECPVCVLVSAVTAQNHDKVIDLGLMPEDRLRAQMKCIDFNQVWYAKLGMLGSSALIEVMCEMLPASTQIILDPVLNSSSGGALLDSEGIEAMRALLFPRVCLLTPNLQELRRLSGVEIHDQSGIMKASHRLLTLGVEAVFAKGGHFQDTSKQSADYYCDSKRGFWLTGSRWPDRGNVRGTGCATATSIACQLNLGHTLDDALVIAKSSISQSIDCAVRDQQVSQAKHQGLPRAYQYLPGLSNGYKPKSLVFVACDTQRLGIYPVVDSVEWIKKLVPLGVSTIQLRKKEGQQGIIEQAVKEAVRYCAPKNVRLFINDHWALAIKHGAYGVHLGQEDLELADLAAISKSGLRLGLSSHSWAEIARAVSVNPSYLALGPIYATTSKDMPWRPHGDTWVRQWVKMFGESMPLVAIGGINPKRAKRLKATGVGSVAMITAITEAADYKAVTRDLISSWEI